MGGAGQPHIDLGVKGEPAAAAQALAILRADVASVGGVLSPAQKYHLPEHGVFSYYGIVALRQNKNMPRSSLFTSSPNGVSAINDSSITIQVLERAMRLLDVLAQQSDPVALKDLAAATGL